MIFLKNYLEIHNWLVSLGYPESFEVLVSTTGKSVNDFIDTSAISYGNFLEFFQISFSQFNGSHHSIDQLDIFYLLDL